MISVKDGYYEFPKPIALKHRLKDILEEKVDEKYYLSDKKIQDMQSWNAYEKPLENMEKIDKNNISPTLTTRSGAYAAGMILIKNATNKGYIKATEGDGIDISGRMEYHRGTVQKDKIQTLSTMGGENVGVVVNMKTQLCNELIKNGKVKENDVIRHSYSNSRMSEWGKTRDKETNNISPTLDTRCDCLGVTVKTIGNYSPSNHNASRVVDNDGLAPTVMENHGTVTATNVSNLRIRKLTPKECGRLMFVKDEDIDKINDLSDMIQYHLFGDSICVNVLMAIFGEMLGLNWQEKVKGILKEYEHNS